MARREQLVALLADGAVHPGPQLAAALGCSRTAVWKQLHALEAFGLQVEALPGRGYRLRQAVELLDAAQIRAALPAGVRRQLHGLEVCFSTDSTSERLRSMPPPPSGQAQVLLAEYQSRGRGRRGRHWLAPLGDGLCLSVGWAFARPPPDLPALGLAAGVAVLEALRASGAEVGLKWPNDVIAGDGKLAGLLVDVSGELAGPLYAVVGVGVNLRVSEALRGALAGEDSLPPVGLASLLAAPPGRNAVAAALIAGLVETLERFSRQGFAPFADAWRRADQLAGRPVTVVSGERRRQGIARGIAADGSLLLEVDGTLESVLSGDVSLRARS